MGTTLLPESIVKLNFEQNGCARAAFVITATRELTWPTVKLAPVLPSSGTVDAATQISARIEMHIKTSSFCQLAERSKLMIELSYYFL